MLAELSWTNAEQTQAIDRVHRIGQREPVTAWRIIAAQTIDAKIAELIDSKAGLAARALDGSDEEVTSSADVQVEALVAMLTGALSETPTTTRALARDLSGSFPVLGSRQLGTRTTLVINRPGVAQREPSSAMSRRKTTDSSPR